MRLILRILLVCCITLAVSAVCRPDEGMYPLSEIHKLKLGEKGIRISADDIYNPNGISLIDAIVSLGGCTGSFVSRDGLIITNHHCAFGAVQQISSPDHDYVTNGFLAKSRQEEIPARGMTVRIVDSYSDVSADVLGAVPAAADPAERSKAIGRKMKELVSKAEQDHPGKRAEVAEMFAGKSYLLFIYTFLRDVRLVYVPPRSIGEFGGENDNWVWPRHTGDFSFLRVYSAPDGSPADFAQANVPFHPRKYLAVNPDGVDENDPVFILGYPGRTFRHRTASFLAYENDVTLPNVSGLYRWEILTMESMGSGNPAVALQLSGRIKGLANTMKNFEGKLKGIRRLDLVGQKTAEDAALQKYILSDQTRASGYGTVIPAIDSIYASIRQHSTREFVLDYLRQSSVLLSIASTLYSLPTERQKPDLDREAAYMDRNFQRTKDGIFAALHNYHEPTDRALLTGLLIRASALAAGDRVKPLDSLAGTADGEQAVRGFIDKIFRASKLSDSASVAGMMGMSAAELKGMDDPFISLIRALDPVFQELRAIRQARDGAMNRLLAQYVDIRQQYQQHDFIPDANSTLRFTFGSITGYSPADALVATPITTLRGVVEKTTGQEPYNTPPGIMDLYKKKAFGRFAHKRLRDIPVALLYNLDTTGGNSGSPLLDGEGRLVGVNFDRTYEATINDYRWSATESRSIAVDIRYVLWVTGMFAGAGNVLEELGVK